MFAVQRQYVPKLTHQGRGDSTMIKDIAHININIPKPLSEADKEFMEYCKVRGRNHTDTKSKARKERASAITNSGVVPLNFEFN